MDGRTRTSASPGRPRGVKRLREGNHGNHQGPSFDKSVGLLVDSSYRNLLPVPGVPKILTASLPISQLCSYKPGAIESKFRPFLFNQNNLMSRVDFTSDEAYGKAAEPGSMAPPAPPMDGQLLKDDDLPDEERERLQKRAKLSEPTEAYHRQAFGLQLTQHITNDVFTERQRFTTGRNAAEKKIFRDPPGYGSKEELAQKIGKTFQAAKEVPVHPTKPHLRPRRVMQVVPDMNLWTNQYVQVAFDELPRGHQMSQRDILHRTSPNPRTTVFGLFAPRQTDVDVYDIKQHYYWQNRGGFQQASETGEGKHVLLGIPTGPPPDSGRQQVKFMVAPTTMKLTKLKAHRLDIKEDTKALRVNWK
ncbi:unnamed protein product [Durusdinium trenchii]|uniref:Uncharacterized protein n=1 Tax=Durusdinium trenchii TaxID=1381693 RepID=A0ABP0QF29_9DINO